MPRKILVTGNHAAAYAVKLARVQVVAAYPITPQTPIVEKIIEFIHNGEMNAEFINVESEHSAMSVCIGASSMGVRTFTATSSQGLLYMHEMLHWASGARLPIVMANVNRTVGPPWSIWPDHNDSVSQRDTGWIQFYCGSCQEIIDTIIQAYNVCEDERVLLPAMICFEGFELSHTAMPIEIPEQEMVDEFMGVHEARYPIPEVSDPFTYSGIVTPNHYFRFRSAIQKGMENAKEVIEEVMQVFNEQFGRRYQALVKTYRCENADVVVVSMGSIGGVVEAAVDYLRRKGVNVGAARIRVFRPFPSEFFRELGRKVETFIVIDRNISFGMEGVIFTELKSSLFNLNERPRVMGFIAGFGGLSVRLGQMISMIKEALEAKDQTLSRERWIEVV